MLSVLNHTFLVKIFWGVINFTPYSSQNAEDSRNKYHWHGALPKPSQINVWMTMHDLFFNIHQQSLNLLHYSLSLPLNSFWTHNGTWRKMCPGRCRVGFFFSSRPGDIELYMYHHVSNFIHIIIIIIIIIVIIIIMIWQLCFSSFWWSYMSPKLQRHAKDDEMRVFVACRVTCGRPRLQKQQITLFCLLMMFVRAWASVLRKNTHQ